MKHTASIAMGVVGASLVSGLIGCSDLRAYFHWESTGRFYETTTQNILWVTHRGEVVNLTSAVGTNHFLETDSGYPKRETDAETARLIWSEWDDVKDKPTEVDIPPFMIGKVAWMAERNDWDLSGYDIAPETGRCARVSLEGTLGKEKPSPRDPVQKRHNCLNLLWEIPVMSFTGLGLLFIAPFVR